MPIASALRDATSKMPFIVGAFFGYLRSIKWMICICHSFVCSQIVNTIDSAGRKYNMTSLGDSGEPFDAVICHFLPSLLPDDEVVATGELLKVCRRITVLVSVVVLLI